MADTITYDDSKLRKFFAAMDPKTRAKALRGGLLRTANTVRKVARANLAATGVHNADRLARGIRSRVERKTIGFAVTIKSKVGKRDPNNASKRIGQKGMHVNRYGNPKPVLGWLELGTVSRSIKKTRPNGRPGVPLVVPFPKKQPHPAFYQTFSTYRRGSLKPLRFMQKTESQTESVVTRTMHDMVRDSIVKTAKRHGFT